MTESTRADTGSADPLGALLLGFATQIDQLAALLGGGSVAGAADQAFASARAFAAADPNASKLADLAGEVGTLVTELGDLLAKLLTALIAALEAIAAMLSSPAAAAPAGGPAEGGFQAIPVRIAPAPHGA